MKTYKMIIRDRYNPDPECEGEFILTQEELDSIRNAEEALLAELILELQAAGEGWVLPDCATEMTMEVSE